MRREKHPAAATLVMGGLIRLHGMDHPGAIRGGVREAAFSVNMAKTDNPTSKVRRMVLLPPAVLAPRGARVVINGHGLAVKQAWPRRTKTSMLDIVPSTLYNLAAS